MTKSSPIDTKPVNIEYKKPFFTKSFSASVVTTVAIAAIAAFSLYAFPIGTLGFYLAADVGLVDFAILSTIVVRNCLHYIGWGEKGDNPKKPSQPQNPVITSPTDPIVPAPTQPTNNNEPKNRSTQETELRPLLDEFSRSSTESSPERGNLLDREVVRLPSPEPDLKGNTLSPSLTPSDTEDSIAERTESPSTIQEPGTSESHSSSASESSSPTGFWGAITSGISTFTNTVVNGVTEWTLDAAKSTLSALEGKRKGLSGGKIQQKAYFLLLENVIDSVLHEINPSLDLSSMPIDKKLEHLKSSDIPKPLQKVLEPLYRLTDSQEDMMHVRIEFFDRLHKTYLSGEYQTGLDIYLKSLKSGSKVEDLEKTRPTLNIRFKHMLQKIGFALFNDMELHTYAEQSVFSIIGSELKNGSLVETLKEDVHRIHEADGSLKGTKEFATYNQLKGHFNLNFRPLMENNFISKLWNEKISKGSRVFNTSCLRFGTPTQETNNDPTIVEHMRLFLDYCVANNLTLLSFQNQNPKVKGTLKGGNESDRLNAVMNLAKEPRYKDTIFAIGIPLDGEFYNQSGPYKDINDAREFTANLYAHIVSNDHYQFNWEQIIDRAHLKHPNIPVAELKDRIHQDIFDLVGRVHSDFFNSKPTLSIDERHAFLFLTNLYLENYFVGLLEPDHYHSQCKDAMDRAMSVLSSIYYLDMIRLGKENDRDEIRNFRTLVHFAPLLIKGTPMHGGRFERMIKAMEVLTKLSKEQKDAIRKPMRILGEETSIADISIPRVNDQQIATPPSKAMSVKEYRELSKYPSPAFTISNFLSHHLSSSKNNTDGLLDQFYKDLNRGYYYRFNGQPLSKDAFRQALLQKNIDSKLVDQIINSYKLDSDPTCFNKRLRPDLMEHAALKVGEYPDFRKIIKWSEEGSLKKNLIDFANRKQYDQKQQDLLVNTFYDAYQLYSQIVTIHNECIDKQVEASAEKIGIDGNQMRYLINQSSAGEIVSQVANQYANEEIQIMPIEYRSHRQNTATFDVISRENQKGIRIANIQILVNPAKIDKKGKPEVLGYVKGTMWIDLIHDTATITLEKPSEEPPFLIERPLNTDSNDYTYDFNPNLPSTSGSSS